MTSLQQTPNALYPKIFKKLEKIKNDACICVCHWQSGLEFEVDHLYGPTELWIWLDVRFPVVSSSFLEFRASVLALLVTTVDTNLKNMWSTAIIWQHILKLMRQAFMPCQDLRHGKMTPIMWYCPHLWGFSQDNQWKRERRNSMNWQLLTRSVVVGMWLIVKITASKVIMHGFTLSQRTLIKKCGRKKIWKGSLIVER